MRCVTVLGLGLMLLGPPGAAAIEEIGAEEDIYEQMVAPPPEPGEEKTAGRRWAVLPEIGYGPDTGGVGGLKFTDRDVAELGITADLEGTHGQNDQQQYAISIGTPHLLDDRFLTLFRARYYFDPQQEFFGLGNNDVGPDAAATQSYQQAEGDLTVGWRPWKQLALNASVGLEKVRIGHGDKDKGVPFTLDVFPDLPGNEGGYVNPFGLSLVWTTRADMIRPSRGWRIILKVTHTDRKLLSDFQFTREVVDIGYLYPLFGGAHVAGARLHGGFIQGPRRDVPFWELERLGGDDTLRGYFPRRFLGSQSVLLNLEYRFKLVEFDFFDLWHVRMDGVAFGEAGRVFITRHELSQEFRLNQSILDRLVSDLKYSYGGGLRFAVSRALVARVDVGFSDEEKGLVYLSFGHAF